MRKILKLVCVSVLGGALTLTAYKHFFENTSIPQTIENKSNTTLFPVSYTPSLGGGTNVDFTTAAEKAVHAVVHVKNSTLSKSYTSFEDLFFGRSQQREHIGTGSGVIISPDGYIITNNHVIDGAQSIEITTNANKTFDAELIGTDPNTDIALLKIETDETLDYTTFGDSNSARIGEWVLAVGNPFNLNSTVTAGIISAKSRDLNKSDGVNESYIQTDAAVNRGNSGGALVNTSGELIGINTAITSISGGFVGYSFAVPSNIARKIFEDIIEYGDVQRGLLGVIGQALDAKFAKRFEVEETEGFYITDLEEGLGADLAGLIPKDIIKSVDGIIINKFADLSGYLSTKRPGEKVSIIYKRNGEDKKVDVRLEKINRSIFFYMEVRELTPEQIDEYGIDEGLYISNMNNRRLYQNGIDNGHIILEVNGQKVNKLSDLKGFQMGNLESILFLNPSGEKEKIILQY